MRSSQLFSFSLPVGNPVLMPALAAAGAASFTTASNELFVNNATATVTAQSSCSPLLPAAVGATNDAMMSATQTSLAGFQNLANVLSSCWYRGSVTALTQQSTKAFYVGGTYYFFGPSLANTMTMSWTSTTDLVNFTAAVPLTPTAAFTIVDVAYNAGTWVFLDSNGTIITMTDLTLFTGLAMTFLPALVTANSYKNIAYINSVWYVIGGSSAGGGYRVSTSTNLSAWTTAIDSGATGGWPTCICQGAGTGAATEILIGCDSDTILKSVNNGSTFAAVATATGLGSTTIIKHVMYSARTGKYYLAANSDNTTSNEIYVAVSSTGTLATATFTTTYAVGASYSGATTNCPMTMVDNGTNVGLCVTFSGFIHYFFYGSTFASFSPLLTAAQMSSPATGAGVQGAKSFFLNNVLISISGGQNNTPPNLATVTGATASTGIAVPLRFPMNANPGVGYNVQWSGLTYLSGSYYAVNGSAVYSSGSAAYTSYQAFLYKLNSTLTLLSCPVAPASANPTTNITNAGYVGLSAGRVNGAGTGINWVGYSTQNVGQGNFTSIFTFNGATFASSQITFAGAGASGYPSTIAISGQPASCLSLPKWSSLLNAYVLAAPCGSVDSSTSYAALVVTSSTLSGAPASTLFNAGAGTTQSNILMLDVLSNGMVAMFTEYYSAGWTAQFTLNNGTQNFALLANIVSPGGYGMWEVDYGGNTYLVFTAIAQPGTPPYPTYLYIWRLSTTGAPVQVYGGSTTTPLLTVGAISVMLRRVISYNGAFYLADATSATSARNAYMLTPNGGTFTVSLVEMYIPGDINYAGVANTYTTTNGVTVLNPTPAPAVFLPAIATAGYFTKVR